MDLSRPGCDHQRGHITDSRFFGNGYATAVSRGIFCDVCRVRRWLTIEAALAAAQASLGLIPAEAARCIGEAAHLENIDLDAVQAETERTGHSLFGLLRVLQAACPGDTGQYIHYGATTQDIQDTAQALEMHEVLDEAERLLIEIAGHLTRLADRHAGTLALGRTHAQPALPITFGLKLASWLDESLRHLDRLAEARGRVLVAQLFGGAGTMASFGAAGPKLLERFAAELGLGAPAIGWHVARDRVAEFVGTLAMIAGSLGRAADEIRTLSRPEFGEAAESWEHGQVGSSTMPHKRNPERCEQVVVLARLAAAQAGTGLTALIGDHERDSRALRLEWACVPDVSHHTLGACTIFCEIVAGLHVDTERLASNAVAAAEQIASEPLMFALTPQLGKQAAHALVYNITQDAHRQGSAVRDLLRAHPEAGRLLNDADLERIFDPAEYLGAAELLTRQVVAAARERLAGNGAVEAPGSPGGGRADQVL